MTLAAEQLSTSCAKQSAICRAECRPNARNTRISGFQPRRQTIRCPASRMQLQPAVGTKLSYASGCILCSPHTHARTYVRNIMAMSTEFNNYEKFAMRKNVRFDLWCLKYCKIIVCPPLWGGMLLYIYIY